MTAPREVVRIDGAIAQSHPEVAAAVLALFAALADHVRGIETNVTRAGFVATQVDTTGWEDHVRSGGEDSLTAHSAWLAGRENSDRGLRFGLESELKVGGSE